MSNEVITSVRKSLSHDGFKTVIPNSIKLAEAPSDCLPISLHAPDSPGALANSNLAKKGDGIMSPDAGAELKHLFEAVRLKLQSLKA